MVIMRPEAFELSTGSVSKSKVAESRDVVMIRATRQLHRSFPKN